MSERTSRIGVSRNLAAFTRLYWAQVSTIRQFAETLPPDDARWYRSLCGRCDVEVASWNSKSFLDDYLESAGRIRSRAFGVLAYVYLHAAYDFPRFLADSFRDFPELSQERRYRAYVLGSGDVWRTIPTILDVVADWVRLPGDRQVARLVGGWFLAHRCAAWATAEALAAAEDRAALEAKLWNGIDQAGRTLLRFPPWRWMRELPYSSDLVTTRTGS